MKTFYILGGFFCICQFFIIGHFLTKIDKEQYYLCERYKKRKQNQIIHYRGNIEYDDYVMSYCMKNAVFPQHKTLIFCVYTFWNFAFIASLPFAIWFFHESEGF